MDGSFMEDLWKGLVLWMVFLFVLGCVLGFGTLALIVWLT
jgi:hypothetical protein